MIHHQSISDAELRKQLRSKTICFGGNKKLKIYGTLQCKSGKQMKRENRVFFGAEQEAVQNGYRPCGHCMKDSYSKWKEANS